MPTPIKVDTYRTGSQLHTSDLHLHSPLADMARLHVLHHVPLLRTAIPIVAGDVIRLICDSTASPQRSTRHVLCILTLPITISHERTVIGAKQLSQNDQDYFAISLGFDSTDAYRSHYVNPKGPFAGRLLFFA